jgi:hypothetical protein
MSCRAFPRTHARLLHTWPKAFSEHQAFTHRTASQAAPVPPPCNTSSLPKQEPLLLDHDSRVDQAPLSELTRRGIAGRKARELLQRKPSQEVMDQIEWTDIIIAKEPADRFHNPPGMEIVAAVAQAAVHGP